MKENITITVNEYQLRYIYQLVLYASQHSHLDKIIYETYGDLSRKRLELRNKVPSCRNICNALHEGANKSGLDISMEEDFDIAPEDIKTTIN